MVIISVGFSTAVKPMVVRKLSMKFKSLLVLFTFGSEYTQTNF